VETLYVNILTGMVKWVAIGGGGMSVSGKGGGASVLWHGVIDRRLATPPCSRRVDKGVEKGVETLSRFHGSVTFSVPSPRPLVHGTCITLPSTSTSLTCAFAHVDVAEIESANFAQREGPSSRGLSIPRYDLLVISIFEGFCIWKTQLGLK